MNKVNFLLCTTALTAMVAGASGHAFAGVITETASYGPLTTPYTGQTLNFLGYTASGGSQTLLSVVVTETDIVNGTVTGANPTSGPLTLSAGVKNILTLSSQPANLSLPGVTTFSNTTGKITVAANSSYTSSNLTGSKSATSTATGSLSDFLGGWSLTFGEQGHYNGSAQTGINLSAQTTGTVDVSVAYTFANPAGVPEPMSAALVGVGLAGMGVIRRRRTAKQ